MANRWTLAGTRPDGAAIEMKGVSADVLRRRADGSWGIVIDDPWGGVYLPRDGLVKRRPDPDDRRATRVHLSPRAKRFKPAERVLAVLEREAERVLGRLGG